MTDERREYLNEYKKENLKRIPLDVHHDFYIRVLQHAAMEGRSVNGYIKRVLALAMDAEDAAAASTDAEKKSQSVREMLKTIGEGNG